MCEKDKTDFSAACGNIEGQHFILQTALLVCLVQVDPEYTYLWIYICKQRQWENSSAHSLVPCTLLLTESLKDVQRMYRVTAVSAGTFGIFGKTQRDVWISEMLHTDEIPREPTMDNGISPQWRCKNQMERGAFRFLFLSAFIHLRRHTHTHTNTRTCLIREIYSPP